MTDNYDGNLEFLKFLADISDPGTGEICIDRLASWLALAPDELVARWHASGHAEWSDYADDVLRILDCVQDRTLCLSRTLRWYRYAPISPAVRTTADEMVTMGRSVEALQAVRCLASEELVNTQGNA